MNFSLIAKNNPVIVEADPNLINLDSNLAFKFIDNREMKERKKRIKL